jgi:hypothetical protein
LVSLASDLSESLSVHTRGLDYYCHESLSLKQRLISYRMSGTHLDLVHSPTPGPRPPSTGLLPIPRKGHMVVVEYPDSSYRHAPAVEIRGFLGASTPVTQSEIRFVVSATFGGARFTAQRQIIASDFHLFLWYGTHVTLRAADVTTVSFSPAEPTPPTADPTHDHGQGSTMKQSLLLACHCVEQLLKRIEPCLAGTPAIVPVNVLNNIIDIGKVCSHLAVSMPSLISTP